MRKIFIAFLMLAVMSVILPLSAAAQQRSYYVKKVVDRNGHVRYVRVRKPSFYRRHRNAVNVGIGSGIGAVIGAVAGGGKGALIGAAAGAGGGALYTYKIKKKKRRYYKVRQP